jgi:anaerobic magnesium-protoporphyrin IX monomethyl ester cyclase
MYPNNNIINKSVDILLIFPPNNMDSVLGGGKHFITALEPLGILYIAAHLEREGYNVKVLDAYMEGFGIEDVIKKIEETKPRAIGMSCLTSDASVTVRLCQKIKERFPDIFLFLGNLHASIYAEYFIKNAKADLIVHGEGEYISAAILKVLKEGGSFSDIKGITYRDGKEIKTTGPAELITDLDALAPPARHMVDIKRYRWPYYYYPSSWRLRPKRMRPMTTSRGCPIGCTFCAVHSGRRPRFVSGPQLYEQFMDLVNNYGADFIFFFDPLFIANPRRLNEFCERLTKNKVNVQWSCEAHVNYVNKDVLKMMKRAGCHSLNFGIESGVQELLDNVGKKSKIEHIEEAVRWTAEAGIEPVGLFMLGLPGEDHEKSLQTIRFAKKLPINHAQFAITVPYPGTALYNQLVSEGKIDDIYNWDRYSAYACFNDKDAIWVPDGMTSDELKKLQRYAITSFFFRPGPAWHLLKKLKFSHYREVWASIMAVVK